jgi:NTE family protein
MFRDDRPHMPRERRRRLSLHRSDAVTPVVAPVRQERCALVLSGGSVFGAVQIGQVRALVEAGIVPDVILGCSVGALNGAFLAGRFDAARVDRLEDIWAGLGARDIFALRSRRTVANLVAGRDHLCEPAGLQSLIRRFCPVADLSELEIELQVVTTDLDAARPHWWSEGDPELVLAASAALPGIFPPVEIGGSRHVDGGVLVPVPVARAFELGATRVYVSDVGTATRPHLPDRLGPLGVLLEAFNVARFAIDAERSTPAGVDVTVLPTPSLDGLSMFDFGHTRRLVAEAYRITRAVLTEPAYQAVG